MRKPLQHIVILCGVIILKNDIIRTLKKRENMEILLLVAKYTFLGIFVFVGATIITKSIGKYVSRKDKNDKY